MATLGFSGSSVAIILLNGHMDDVKVRNMHSKKIIIIGAGPAGLGAAYELVKNGITDLLLIDRNSIVGGLSRTEVRDGARFDIGPHRFFTKNKEVNDLWHELLGRDFVPVDRLTRIYYKNKYFNYPIRLFDVLTKLGILESFHAFLSYLLARFSRKQPPVTFEDWVVQNFGAKLYETFFKTYTEKIWGISCKQIGAEWAAQRIRGLDIIQVLRKAILGGKRNVVKTLVEQFDYPVHGAGQMYERMADVITSKGGELLLNATVKSFRRDHNKIELVEVATAEGARQLFSAEFFFTSTPLPHFFRMLTPSPTEEILAAADSLYFREHITVNLLLRGRDFFPDQWIYVHSPNVEMARLANYNNFSKAMVDDPGKSAVSVEYFAFQHEELWRKSDEELIQLAVAELSASRLVPEHSLEKGWVIRETECYPTYYLGYTAPYELLRAEMDEFENLIPIGRAGLYKYNNQDHSLYSGILAARNYMCYPERPYNIWNINIDAEYHEGSDRKDG